MKNQPPEAMPQEPGTMFGSVSIILFLSIQHQRHARYIVYTSNFISSSSKYLTGVHHFLSDIYPDFNKHCSHPLVLATIAGSKKTRGNPVHRKTPLRPSHLEVFVHVARCSGSYNNFLFAILISCCFYACHCSGKLMWKNETALQDWRKVIK